MKLALWAYEAPSHVGACKAAASLSGVHAILRAPKGDGYATIMLAMFERLGVSPPLSISALSEATLAGAPPNIVRLIEEVDVRERPELIVIARSATASVLQEPLDGELSQVSAGRIAADILFSEAHPVRDTETSAFAATLKQLVAHYATDGERTAYPSVNIIGPSLLGFHDHSNVESLRRLFTDLGINVNAIVPLGGTIGDLRRLGRAWLNITTAWEVSEPAMRFLKDRFGTPYLETTPYGEAGTNRFLTEALTILEVPATRIKRASRTSRLGWYARTVDAHALSGKRVAVFGAPSAAAGLARVFAEELDMRIEFVGTYVERNGDWLRKQTADLTGTHLVTDDYRSVAALIDETRPDIVFGSQMERHSSSRYGVPCAVISPPAHILNFPLGYAPFVGYEGANHIGDVVNQTQVLGLEHHLIETFGPRNQGRYADAVPEGEETLAPSTAAGELAWLPDAERLVGRIPFFVRRKARANIERYARERNIAQIDERIVLAAREHVGG